MSWDLDYPTEAEYEANLQALRDSFKDNGDTHFCMTLDEYIGKFKEAGFEEVLKSDFTHTSNQRRAQVDSYYIFAHRDGWLLTFDTFTHDFENEQGYSEKVMNVAELHYTWKPTHSHFRGSLTSNGGMLHHDHIYNEKDEIVTRGDLMEPNIWAGYHDVREGLDHVMASLKANGEILNPWIRNEINWLAAHHSVPEQERAGPPPEIQTKDTMEAWYAENRAKSDRWYAAIKALSLANYTKLPDWVKTMISGPCR